MWFEIIYGIEGICSTSDMILSETLEEAYSQALALAHEEYHDLAGKVEGCPTFTQFCEDETADDVVDMYDNNRTEYEQLQKRFTDFIDSKIIVRAYYA